MKTPVDLEFFRLVDTFAKEQLSAPIQLGLAADIWAVCRMEDDRPVEVLAIAGWQQAIDVFLFRTKPDPQAGKATKMLWQRINDFFNDKGCRGMDALLYISETETEEQRCPQWKQWLVAAGAKSAERQKVKVR